MCKFNMKLLLFIAVFIWSAESGNVEACEPEPYCGSWSVIQEAIAVMRENEIRFSLQLYKAMSKTEKMSFALSTADIFISLLKLHCSVDGLTKNQFNAVFDHSLDCYVSQYGLQDFVDRTNSLKAYQVNLNNEIFYDVNLHLEEIFTTVMERTFRSHPRAIDFSDNAACSTAISEWASAAGITYPTTLSLAACRALVLVAAAEFRLWGEAASAGSLFRSVYNYNAATQDANFSYVRRKDELTWGQFTYSNSLVAQYIKFSWTTSNEGNIQTFFVLPKEINGIAELENSFNEGMIYKMLSNKEIHTVKLTIPAQLCIETFNDLSEVLRNMQLTQMFIETNDFLRISATRHLAVDKFLHQIVINNGWVGDIESGSEEEFDINVRAGKDAKTFVLDRPFMVLTILDDTQPIILSMGRHGWLDCDECELVKH